MQEIVDKLTQGSLGQLTAPGYRYLGPGNPLPNGKPINYLDSVAMQHDYMYEQANQLQGKERTRKLLEADEMMLRQLNKPHPMPTKSEQFWTQVAKRVIGFLANRRRAVLNE